MLAGDKFNFDALMRSLDSRDLPVFNLGILLRDGIPLVQALRQVAVNSQNRSIKNSAARAAELLAAGNACAEVFAGSETRGFPAHARFILASPLEDPLKGHLLSSWQPRYPSAFSFTMHLYYPAQSIAIGFLSMLSLVMFVLPQFREIMLGTGLPLNGISGWIIDTFCRSEALLLIFFAPFCIGAILAMVFYIGKFLFGAYDSYDQLNLFRMLSQIPSAQRFRVLEVMAAPHNFPQLARPLKAFARAVNSGESIVPAAEKSGLDGLTSWFLQLSAIDAGSSLILEQGATLLETRVNCGLERAGRLLEIASVLLQGVLFGGVIFAVFQTMINIMLGAIV